MAVVLARIRMPLIYLGLAAIAVDSFLVDLPRWPLLALLAVAFAVYLRLGPCAAAGRVAPPVAGRWLAFNSPADRVPSHHLHAYGQTYAVDLVNDPAGGGAPASPGGPWPGARPTSPGSASRSWPPPTPPWSGPTTPSATTGAAPHRRPALPGRRGDGPRAPRAGRILGNHLVLDLGDGVYAALATCAAVAPGPPGDGWPPASSWPPAGTRNSTEPHLHPAHGPPSVLWPPACRSVGQGCPATGASPASGAQSRRGTGPARP